MPKKPPADNQESSSLLAPERRSDVEEVELCKSTAVLDVEDSIYEPAEIGLVDNPDLNVFGEVSLKGSGNNSASIALVRVEWPGGEWRAFLAGLEKDEDGHMRALPSENWVRLEDGREVTIGRESGGEDDDSLIDGVKLFGRQFTPDISRRHIRATLQGESLSIEDISSNGSAYRGDDISGDESEDYSYRFSHTMSAEEAARLHRQLKRSRESEQELFQGRPVINRDTFPIDGHVDIRSWATGDEAIVVDSEKYPEEFEELRRVFDRKLWQATGSERPASMDQGVVLKAIYETVNDTMEYDLEFVEQESKRVAQVAPDHRKSALNTYLSHGKGVCRHMALAVSWLGGDAVARGYIKGRFTTEVNQSTKGNGAHEWSRFVNDADPRDVFIVDVAQHFVGKLIDTDGKSAGGQERWGYFRDKEERDLYRKLKVGKTTLPTAITKPSRMITSDDVPKN